MCTYNHAKPRIRLLLLLFFTFFSCALSAEELEEVWVNISSSEFVRLFIDGKDFEPVLNFPKLEAKFNELRKTGPHILFQRGEDMLRATIRHHAYYADIDPIEKFCFEKVKLDDFPIQASRVLSALQIHL